MKKLTLFCGVAALALASCSNDELVENIAADQGADAPIGFAVSTGNMTRDAGDPTQLSDEHWDFGVWAYKGTSAPTTAVMKNYMVGYWDETNQLGYYPNNKQELFGSNYKDDAIKKYAWYYETLGYEQQKDWTDKDNISGSAGFVFKKGSTDRVASTSEVEYQYLKYWDKAAGMKTWFYAYAPYSLNGNTEETKVKFDNSNHKLSFPEISSISDNGKSAMYAGTMVENPNSPNENTNKYVNLEFKRLLAQVRLAFYEEVAGYKVELIPYGSYTIPTADRWNTFTNNAMFAVPANVGDPKYTFGSYVTSAKPVVTFDNDMTKPATVTYDAQKCTRHNINIPLWFFSGATQTNVLGTTHETAIMNQVKEVLPSGDTYCGFTINLSLKFTALDTGEEIIVKGVRVHIPKADCQWLANHRYTYYFKVTKNVPGSPIDPSAPDPTPGTDPYLLPIVFDSVTVQAIEDVEHEYDVNKVD